LSNVRLVLANVPWTRTSAGSLADACIDSYGTRAALLELGQLVASQPVHALVDLVVDLADEQCCGNVGRGIGDDVDPVQQHVAEAARRRRRAPSEPFRVLATAAAPALAARRRLQRAPHRES
jgi:hypothetical protein